MCYYMHREVKTFARGELMDWEKIKKEYISDPSSSYRKLAEKYGVSRVSVGQRAKKEGWVSLREKHLDRTLTKAIRKIEDRSVERQTKIFALTDKILLKLEAAADGLETTDTAGLRQIVASVKDIKDIQMIRSPADQKESELRLREHELRMKVLQKQIEEESADNSVKIVFGEGEEFGE